MLGLTMLWLRVQAKMERADALAEERAALTNYMRNTLITNELKFKEVRHLHVHTLLSVILCRAHHT